MTAQGAQRRESDFISVIPGIALQNKFPDNFSFRALFKQVATSCGRCFLLLLFGVLFGWFIFCFVFTFFFLQKSIQSCFIKTGF